MKSFHTIWSLILGLPEVCRSRWMARIIRGMPPHGVLVKLILRLVHKGSSTHTYSEVSYSFYSSNFVLILVLLFGYILKNFVILSSFLHLLLNYVISTPLSCLWKLQICNGATFVMVDKINNPRDNGPMLLFQGKWFRHMFYRCKYKDTFLLLKMVTYVDDGGGMDPEGIRRCMSLGFSNKKSKTTIGQCKL